MIASAKMRESKYLQAPHAADEKIWCLPLMNGNREKKHCWKDLPSCPPSFQSRTQSPQAPWSAVWSPGETLGKWNFFNFFDWLFG